MATESHLIGNILSEDQDDHQQSLFGLLDKAQFRSTSAPPAVMSAAAGPEQLASMFSGSADANPEDIRLTPAYYHYYYSLRPVDPRLPPPLLSHSQVANMMAHQQQMNQAFPFPPQPPQKQAPIANFALSSSTSKPGPLFPPPVVANPAFQPPATDGSGFSVFSNAPRTRPTSLVDMIQGDFPRTPSPVYQALGSAHQHPLLGTASQAGGNTHISDAALAAQFQSMSVQQQQGQAAVPPPPATHQPFASPLGLSHQPSKPPGITFPPQRSYLKIDPSTGTVLPAQQPPKKPSPFFEFNPAAAPWKPPSPIRVPNVSNFNYAGQFYHPGAGVQQRHPPTGGFQNFGPIVKKSHPPPLFESVYGRVVELAQDQHGSRFVQQRIEAASDTERALMFQEVLPEALDLMNDVFGNYVIQKFLEFGTDQQRSEIADVMKGHVLALSLHTYGCRVVQKALDSLPDLLKFSLSQELSGHILQCVQDQNGNHVIQKCIEKIPPSHTRFIVEAFLGNVATLACHAYGCRVIQRILEHCPEYRQAVLDEVLAALSSLSEDQYGNYVVQHVAEAGDQRHRTAIMKYVMENLAKLSQHKFASNVVEKCFQHGSRRDRQLMVDEVTRQRPGAEQPLLMMMKDQFGNFVVQKMMDAADETQKRQLVEAIRPHIAMLKKYTYGKHILQRMEKMGVK